MHYTRLVAIATLAASLALVGCESSDDIDGNIWAGESSTHSTSSSTENTTNTDSTVANAAEDAVAYSSLNWTFGGVKGGSAAISAASIGGLSISGNTLAYKWTGADLSSWGLSHSDHTGAYACLFVKRSDDSWVGGKFDWISSSRTTRSLTNVNNGYSGWTLSGVPNPCEAAFVIISKDGKRRTNVIKTNWSH